MDTDTAFQRIQRALEEFSNDIEKTRVRQALSQQQIAAAEYELEQMKRLIAENVLAG